MSRNNTTFGKNIVHFMSRYHIHISSNTIYLINTNVGPTTHSYYTKFRDHCRANKPHIKTIAEAARCAKELQAIFPLTSRCCHLILTAPMTSASSERSFSKLKLIKTVMRSMMKQERLKDGCERDLTDSINLDKLVDRWAELPKTRRIISVE